MISTSQRHTEHPFADQNTQKPSLKKKEDCLILIDFKRNLCDGRFSCVLEAFSTEMSPQVMLYSFLLLNDSTCQFYYMEHTREKSGRGVTFLVRFIDADASSKKKTVHTEMYERHKGFTV